MTWCLLPVFFFNDTATTEIYTLSLHDALPISWSTLHLRDVERTRRLAEQTLRLASEWGFSIPRIYAAMFLDWCDVEEGRDRKSTRLNSSHQIISYAVFCLKKKNDALAHTSSVD